MGEPQTQITRIRNLMITCPGNFGGKGTRDGDRDPARRCEDTSAVDPAEMDP